MDDLLGDLQEGPASLKNQGHKSAFDDLLSFEPSQPAQLTSTQTAEAGDVTASLIDFNDFSRLGTKQDGSDSLQGSIQQTSSPFGRNTDNTGHAFVSGNKDRDDNHMPGKVSAVLKPSTQLLDAEDEFGDFVDSPEPNTGTFQTIDVSLHTVSMDVPSPTALLHYLMQEILVVPSSFINELAVVSYTLKRAILSSARTRKWLDAMVEASRVAQRIIHGRDRRVKDVQARREARMAAERMAQEWSSSLMPRLSSLSSGTLRLKPFKLNAYNEIDDRIHVCAICGTEEEDAAPLERSVAAGLLGHRSCIALASKYAEQ